MSGFVYFVRCGSFIKIGFSTNALKRFAELKNGIPLDVSLAAYFPGSLHYESWLHRRFLAFHHRGEWFRSNQELEAFIRDGLPIAEIEASPKLKSISNGNARRKISLETRQRHSESMKLAWIIRRQRQTSL